MTIENAWIVIPKPCNHVTTIPAAAVIQGLQFSTGFAILFLFYSRGKEGVFCLLAGLLICVAGSIAVPAEDNFSLLIPPVALLYPLCRWRDGRYGNVNGKGRRYLLCRFKQIRVPFDTASNCTIQSLSAWTSVLNK